MGGSVQAHGYLSVIHGYVGAMLSSTYMIDYASGTNNAGTTVAQTSSGPSANSWYITEEACPSTGTEYADYFSSSGALIGALTGSDTQDSSGNTYLYLGMYDGYGGEGTVNYQYVFLATLLPNNAMPSSQQPLEG